MRIDLHIERLVLDGLPLTGAEGARVGRAVERELARLLAKPRAADALRRGGTVPDLRAPPFELGAGDRPDAIGRKIARAVHGGLGRPA
jgi:hypothetical protein